MAFRGYYVCPYARQFDCAINFWRLSRGGGVLENSRGNTWGIYTPNALVASRKLLPVLIEVAGVKFPFIVLM